MGLQYTYNGITYSLTEFKDVGRVVSQETSPNCFYLPQITISPIEEEGFIGDMTQGGTCNVDLLTFTPHNITHLETSAHILAEGGKFVSDIPQVNLTGICYLVDLSQNTENITLNDIKEVLDCIELPISLLAIKTRASLLDPNYDFSGKDFLSLTPEAAKEISQFQLNGEKVSTLLLDLPSADPENDGGKLLAHRAFFEIPPEVHEFTDNTSKAIVELARFNNLEEGYYYCVISPPRIRTNAVPVSVALAMLSDNVQT